MNLICKNSMSSTETPLKTHEEITEALRKILVSNDVKEGTKKARTIECSFIQGMCVAEPRYAKNAYLVISLMSGRSILN